MKRKISEAARERGAANLAGWRAKNDKRANKLESDVNQFREGLLRDLGPNPTTSRLALVESATSIYAAIVRARHAVIRGPKAEVGTLVERVSWLTGNMIRLLKHLNLDAKPKPEFVPWGPNPKVEQDAAK